MNINNNLLQKIQIIKPMSLNIFLYISKQSYSFHVDYSPQMEEPSSSLDGNLSECSLKIMLQKEKKIFILVPVYYYNELNCYGSFFYIRLSVHLLKSSTVCRATSFICLFASANSDTQNCTLPFPYCALQLIF